VNPPPVNPPPAASHLSEPQPPSPGVTTSKHRPADGFRSCTASTPHVNRRKSESNRGDRQDFEAGDRSPGTPVSHGPWRPVRIVTTGIDLSRTLVGRATGRLSRVCIPPRFASRPDQHPAPGSSEPPWLDDLGSSPGLAVPNWHEPPGGSIRPAGRVDRTRPSRFGSGWRDNQADPSRENSCRRRHKSIGPHTPCDHRFSTDGWGRIQCGVFAETRRRWLLVTTAHWLHSATGHIRRLVTIVDWSQALSTSVCW